MADLWIVSLIGAVMILVIIGVRALLQNRLHRTVFLLLWLLVAVRLAVPVMTSSTASIYNFLPEKESVSAFASRESVQAPVVIVEEPAVRDPVAGESVIQGSISGEISALEPVEIGESRNQMSLTMGQLLTLFWALGCGACFLYFMVVHICTRHRYRFAIPEKGPDYLGKVALKRSDEVSSPLVYGFFRPVILLPCDFPKKDSPEYEQVLCHELTHIRSGDLWYKLIMLLITCVHWFNPFVWLMLRLSTQDMEIRCDARVIRKLGKKKAYAMTLLQAEVQRETHLAEAAFAFSLTELRIRSILKSKVYLPRSIVLSALLSVILIFCFSTGPVANASALKPQPEEVVEFSGDTLPATIGTEMAETESEIVLPSKETEETDTLPAESTEEILSLTEREEGTEESSSIRFGDHDGYEEHGTVLAASLGTGEYRTYRLALPERTTYEINGSGEASEWQASEIFDVNVWYDSEKGYLYITVMGKDYGRGNVSFYIDGNFWCKLSVSVGYRSMGTDSSKYEVDLTFDYSGIGSMDLQTSAPDVDLDFDPQSVGQMDFSVFGFSQ